MLLHVTDGRLVGASLAGRDTEPAKRRLERGTAQPEPEGEAEEVDLDAVLRVHPEPGERRLDLEAFRAGGAGAEDSQVVLADGPRVQLAAQTRLPQSPGRIGVAVGTRPRTVALQVRVPVD